MTHPSHPLAFPFIKGGPIVLPSPLLLLSLQAPWLTSVFPVFPCLSFLNRLVCSPPASPFFTKSSLLFFFSLCFYFHHNSLVSSPVSSFIADSLYRLFFFHRVLPVSPIQPPFITLQVCPLIHQLFISFMGSFGLLSSLLLLSSNLPVAPLYNRLANTRIYNPRKLLYFSLFVPRNYKTARA